MAAAGSATTAADEALASLCQAYWFPLYAYVRRCGHNSHDAHDLTQGFFARLLDKRDLQSVDPGKGKFRSFMLACVKHFLSNERDRNNAIKRGGGRTIVSIDVDRAEQRYAVEPADHLTPEKLFERQWALTLLEHTLATLHDEAVKAGRGEVFDRLQPHLVGEATNETYADHAEILSMTEDAIKATVYRLRKRFQKRLRERIAETVADDSEVEDELKALFAALSG